MDCCGVMGGMARRSRIDGPGALKYIVIRGMERRAIFNDTKDYRDFLAGPSHVLRGTTISCYAWVVERGGSSWSERLERTRRPSRYREMAWRLGTPVKD